MAMRWWKGQLSTASPTHAPAAIITSRAVSRTLTSVYVAPNTVPLSLSTSSKRPSQ